LLSGAPACVAPQRVQAPIVDLMEPELSLLQELSALGRGLRFFNAAVRDGALVSDDGAEFAYARTFSSNARVSPVGIEIWVFSESGRALHRAHTPYLKALYESIYAWDPALWEQALEGRGGASDILREKSDFFWESLAQQLAERIFAEGITPALYRFGPHCAAASDGQCSDKGIAEAQRVVVRTYLDASRDPMNPVTRTITYGVLRDALQDPELIFELQVPNGFRVAGPHQEVLDFRPCIRGELEHFDDMRVLAHLPPGHRTKTKNADYPDYNLLFVPLRHLVFQGEVSDPKLAESAFHYATEAELILAMRTLIARLRTSEGARSVAAQVRPFLSAKYYYMFDEGGQGISDYRAYMLGAEAGIARGLSPDFGRIEMVVDGRVRATFYPNESER